MKNYKEDINLINESLATRVNIAILFIHIGLLVAFVLVDAPIMIVMNIFSIATYIFMFKVIHKNLVIYLTVVYFEVLVHMTLASVCLGWKCGFQLYFFAFIPLIYFAHYISKKRKLFSVRPLPVCLLTMLVFFIIRLTTYEDDVIYNHIKESTKTTIFAVNIVMIFAFLIVFMHMFEQITLKSEEHLQHMAEHDLLTGLSNRIRMTPLFEKFIEQNVEFTVAILDIDDFKKVNDTYGHVAGDTTLKAFAEILSQAEQDNVYTCRWGGEEFLVVMTGDNSYETSKALLELIRVNVSNIKIPTDDGDIKITISAGISQYKPGERCANTINRADSYLYIAKKSGKNQIIANDHC